VVELPDPPPNQHRGTTLPEKFFGALASDMNRTQRLEVDAQVGEQQPHPDAERHRR